MSRFAKRGVGLAAIVGLILLVVVGVSRPDPFSDVRVYRAEFDSAQGLGAIGRDIRVAGVNVGTIGEVERDGDNAVVELRLERPIPVKTDARAEMRPHTLFEGSSFIDLAPGSPSAPELEEDGLIGIGQTSNYVTLDEALRVLRPQIREDLSELARVGSRTLRGGTIEGIQQTLRNGPELTERLKGPARALQGSDRKELAGAIAGMAQTVEAVAEKESDLIPLARRANRTVAALTVDGAGPLDAAVAALPGALRELDSGAPELTRLIDGLDTLAAEIDPAVPRLTEALGEATPLLEKTIPVLEGATPIVSDLRKIGDRLAEAAPTLAQLVREIDPVSETLGESILPVLLSPSRTGPPTYEQLLATFTAANAVFRPYQTEGQNPNGIGHIWNLGTYFEDNQAPFAAGASGGASAGRGPATTGGTAPCESVAEVSREAERLLSAIGGCE